MESKAKSASSGDFMSEKRNDSSSAMDRKKVSNTDGSSTPTESKRHCPDSREPKSVIDIDGSSKTVRRSDTKKDRFSAISTKPHGKGLASDESRADIMFFSEVTQGPHQNVLWFRLIHFWEARNQHSKLLVGEEMLLIDEKGTAIQDFIPSGHVDTYLPHLKAGSLYELRNFFGSRSKENYRVADHNVTVSFSWNSVLKPLKEDPVPFPGDRFRFHSHDEFEVKCDQRGDLYDYVGHMKLLEGQPIGDCPRLDEVAIAAKRHVLWPLDEDVSMGQGCSRLLPKVQVKWKYFGCSSGTLALASMPPSRVFMDTDVHETREYLCWLNSNLDIANSVTAEVVTKPESVTISELFAYMKQENAKVAWFECTVTIDDVFRGSAWYYISCGGCHSKATKGPNSLICTNKKCGRTDVTGVPEYIVKVYVYDKSEQAVFVILGSAGRELTGKHASELVANYFESNESVGADCVVPVPQVLLESIGQTHRFIVKVSDHKLTGKTQSITVTKVLPQEQAPHLTDDDAADEKIEGGSGSEASEAIKSG